MFSVTSQHIFPGSTDVRDNASKNSKKPESSNMNFDQKKTKKYFTKLTTYTSFKFKTVKFYDINFKLLSF